jgi:predicted RNA-binding Zn-ribbon protein involved in translation (DUF1610 family)
MKKLEKDNLSGAMGLAVALAIAAAIGASAQDASASSKPWLPFKRVETAKQFRELPAKTQIAMACARCKSVVVTVKRNLTTKPGHGTVEELLTVDQCPGCGGKMIVRADKQTEMVHTCSKCGDDSAFCCATAKDAKPTRGMEKK